MFFRKFAVVTTLAATLGACAAPGDVSPSSSAADRRAAVLKRADARGAALVRGDLDGAYAFLSEGSKAVISLQNFRQRMSVVQYTGYRIDDASCDAESCKVQAKVTYDHRVMKGVTTPMTETWVAERGGLYFVFPSN